jgi:tetratricopeptide (TPR) repeat protein
MMRRLLASGLFAIPLALMGSEATTGNSEALGYIRVAMRDRASGYSARAEAEYRRALNILERTSGSQSPDLTPALNGLAGVCFEERRYTEAEQYSRRSAALAEASLGAEHPLLATALHNLGAIYYAQGQYDKAAPLFARALAIRERSLGENHAFVAATLAAMAELDSAQGNHELAAARYARALEIREAAFGSQDPRVAETLVSYAAVLRKGCHKHESAIAEARSRSILAESAFRSPGRDVALAH